MTPMIHHYDFADAENIGDGRRVNIGQTKHFSRGILDLISAETNTRVVQP
jgi:hypothetical protein